jgi:exodeoxyribonuclease V beta subunit
MDAFDIRGPLPTGTTLLEASAGTGKTWTIGALVARFVAEGVAALEEMLVVTFGRAASQELRERVRDQLVEAERAFAEPDAPRPANDLVDLLLEGPDRELRHRRLREALAAFDAATIATTHQFCSMVLGSLGVAGDTDAQARLVEDLDQLTGEVVDDLYLRAFAWQDGTPAFTRAEAGAIAKAATGRAGVRLEPAEVSTELDEPVSVAARRVAFGHAVRQELENRKRRLGILSYDDLLSQLADALEADDSPARTRMRQRWKIVLVDEFQDTDPVQWQVLDRAFTGHATMVLIGDPKQAIYAFRGGDVVTYLAAAETATTRKTLSVNWRSDQRLLDGFQTMLEGAALGDPRIVVHPVRAQRTESRLQGAPSSAPVRLRAVTRSQFGKQGNRGLAVKDVRPLVSRDLALDIKALLASGATYDGRPLEARDVAVIAYQHRDLADAREALRAVGVPAVIAGGGSVFGTPAALSWLELLEAVEQPHRGPRVRTAALSCFFGHTARALDEAGDRLTDDIADRLRDWAEVMAARGVAAVLELASSAGLQARVLSIVGGERDLTDLRHVAEALHEVALADRLGLVALISWLRDRITEAREGRGTERTRRLDSDAAAVQLVTVHASKGLEYPVVYLSSLADRFVGDPAMPSFHDDEGHRCLAVGGRSGAGWAEHVRRHQEEEAGEWLRLLYVAITRATSQVVLWWSPNNNAQASPLHRMLQGRTPGSAAVPDTFQQRDDAEALRIFRAWEARGALALEPAVPAAAPAGPASVELPPLAARVFSRTIDTEWRRTSYSSLTAVDRAEALMASVSSEPESTGKDDEPDAVEEIDVATGDGPPSPMGGLPVGATFGSLVHAVLEHADPEAADLEAELLAHIDEQLVRWPVDLDRSELAAALVAVCESPLGPVAEGLTLREIPLRSRLCELEFELPLAGGDDRSPDAADVRLGDVAPLLREHLAPGDPLLPYADALDDPALGRQSLRGYLTGSVDVVLRTPSGASLVVDYKTNWLGERDAPLTAEHYTPSLLAGAMGHSTYPLQALLYAVVLHRYLRWRQPSYDPAVHLGGVLYLYLRGMCGPETPLVDGQPCGVFAWRPPVALVAALSDLLDGGKA